MGYRDWIRLGLFFTVHRRGLLALNRAGIYLPHGLGKVRGKQEYAAHHKVADGPFRPDWLDYGHRAYNVGSGVFI